MWALERAPQDSASRVGRDFSAFLQEGVAIIYFWEYIPKNDREALYNHAASQRVSAATTRSFIAQAWRIRAGARS